jgi:hypothetical protein
MITGKKTFDALVKTINNVFSNPSASSSPSAVTQVGENSWKIISFPGRSCQRSSPTTFQPATISCGSLVLRYLSSSSEVTLPELHYQSRRIDRKKGTMKSIRYTPYCSHLNPMLIALPTDMRRGLDFQYAMVRSQFRSRSDSRSEYKEWKGPHHPPKVSLCGNCARCKETYELKSTAR